ncbi:MAG: DEAD/DEAH box helicase family protein [Leptospirales bacterium]|nr:DEAD/DEAH box helicase family protein [Leptospirales bacterium]
MKPDFFDAPILNSPYEYPARHWELDESGQPTGAIIETRRQSRLISPIPKPQKQSKKSKQAELDLKMSELDSAAQKYNPIPIINEVRSAVDAWRNLPNSNDWMVTPETARLLDYWRNHNFQGLKPFFCQVEAVETLIWLSEVAPRLGKNTIGSRVWEHLKNANGEANPELMRIALKLATGAGKTTVMAMIIAWQVVNAIRRPNSNFSRGFLIVTPGITIKDRLRVLLPNDPQNYFRNRELVPSELVADMQRATIVITNYHALKRKEKLEISKVGRALLKGRGPDIQSRATEGEMIRDVMSGLMGMKNIIVMNDEGHHCYRAKTENFDDLTGDEKEEAKQNNEAARLWISGLEIVKRKMGIRMVYDLSATPFFLRGSGYNEGTLFHWTVSDFSLMDAIESGIVKLPRIPIADNSLSADEMPKFRNLWDHIGNSMSRQKQDALPPELCTALDILYNHYGETFDLWQQAGHKTPPVFIVVANNTGTSKRIYEYIAGSHKETEHGVQTTAAHFPLFSNYESGERLARPRTLLIDSAQIETGDALDKTFRDAAAPEIEQFKRHMLLRGKSKDEAENISEATLLREVMNTVGKAGELGESIRCVVSVSMLTEGWDANTVTHILGVRAFGTQLLCEQVVGRGLRRQSYELGKDNLFPVEYADILGIPFTFTAKAVKSKPQAPQKHTVIEAVEERNHLEIMFPRVEGYRVELPEDKLTAQFNPDSELVITPELVGPSIVKQSGIVGETVNLTLGAADSMRDQTLIWRLTRLILTRHFLDADGQPKLYLAGQLRRIVGEWISGGYLKAVGAHKINQVLYPEIADRAAEKIKAAISASTHGQQRILAEVDPDKPVSSSRCVRYSTTKNTWTPDKRKSHINAMPYDSAWESEFCRVVESHPRVISYVKNQNLGLEVPYLLGTRKRKYIPDFIVRVDDGFPDPLNLIVEIKGYRGEDAKEKANTMRSYWVPGVNHLVKYGRWEFAEFKDGHAIDSDFSKLIDSLVSGALRKENASEAVT